MSPIVIVAGVAVAITSVAAVIDVRKGHIPNWLTLGGAGLGVTLNVALAAAGQGGHGVGRALLMSALGVVACSIVPVFMFWRKKLGGGDVKLFMALGALLGPMLGVDAQLYAMVFASLLAVPIRMAWRGQLGAFLRDLGRQIANAFRPESRRLPVSSAAADPLRLGPSILAGTALALLLR